MPDLDGPSALTGCASMPKCKIESSPPPVQPKIEDGSDIEVVWDDLEEKAENMVEIYDLDSFEDAEKIIKSNKRMEEIHKECKRYDEQQSAEDVKDEPTSKTSSHDQSGLRSVVFSDGKTYLTRGGKTFWPASTPAGPSKVVATVAGHVSSGISSHKKNSAAEHRIYKARYPSATPPNPLPFGKRAGNGTSSLASQVYANVKLGQLPIRQGKPKGSHADLYAPYPPPASARPTQPAQPRHFPAQGVYAAPALSGEASRLHVPTGLDNLAFGSSSTMVGSTMPPRLHESAQQTPSLAYLYDPTAMYTASSNAHYGGGLQNHGAIDMGTHHPSQHFPSSYPTTTQSAPPFGHLSQPPASTHTPYTRCPDTSRLVAGPQDAINVRDLIPRGSTLLAEAAHVIKVGLPPRYHTRTSGYTVSRLVGNPCEFECPDADGFVALGDHVAFYKF